MKWAILATGNIANKFANTVNQMQVAGEPQELVACGSRSKEKAEAFAAEHQIPRAYGSYEEMLADPEVEAVYVATPNTMHYDNCKMCLNAGKHVLCEKPFTVHHQEAEELYQLAEEKKLFIMEGFWIRFLPALMKMQELIRNGEIGHVVWARSDYGFIAQGDRRARKFAPGLAGGALLDIGIYNLGFMRMVMGDAQPESFTSSYHFSEYGTDDFSSVLLKYPEGRSAVVTTSIGMQMPRYAAVYGTNGAMYLEDFQHADRLKVCVNDKAPYTVEYPIQMGGFEYEIREAERCVRAGMSTSDILKKEDSLEILKLMEDILDSWKK